VQRREVDAVLDLVDHRVVDDHRAGQLLAAVDDAVADGVDVGERLDTRHPGLRRHQPAQHVVEGGAVVAQRRGPPHRRLALGAQGDQRLAADAFENAARQRAVLVAIDHLEVGRDDLELERGAATVEDEDVHGSMVAAFAAARQVEWGGAAPSGAALSERTLS